ncbi:MAG: FCD domain-containing protein [Syntrophobacteraceae bacterium]|jgi:GntR family transcriptional repressor for pyruvate dehydrogenase complex
MFEKIISMLEDKALASNSQRIKEIIQFRYILEPEIAALAAESIGDNDLVRIQTILDAQEKNLLENADDAKEDLRFHIALARATKNEVIGEIFAVLYDILRECRVPPLQNSQRKKTSLQGHLKIYRALKERDSESSRMAMRDHLNDVESLLYPPG